MIIDTHPFVPTWHQRLAMLWRSWQRRQRRVAPVRQVFLDKRRIYRLARPLGCRIECIAGVLWITHDRDCKDVFLEAGQQHVSDRRTPMLVQALEASHFRVTAGR